MTDKVLSDSRDIQWNIDSEFKVWFTKVWFTFAVDMAKSVGVEPSLPMIGDVGAAIVITFQERIMKRTTDVLL